MNELLKRAEDLLARAEGYFAAAAYTEQHSPPFERGRKWQELVDIRDLLADLEKANCGEAEVEQLKAEIERLRAGNEYLKKSMIEHATLMRHVNEHLDTREADNERLRAALQQIADIFQKPMSYDCEPIDIARRALEPKSPTAPE